MNYKNVYISLPISGREGARERAEELRREVLRRWPAAVAVTPFDVTAGMEDGATYGELMGRDIAYIIDTADAVVFAADYYTSTGCRLEVNAARLYKKEIVYL